MSKNYNRYGLSRQIPQTIKRIVRERCCFGCVVCGAVPYDYDHFLVQWADAKEHNPDDIILLCDKHHRQKTAHILDVDTIRTALNNRSAAHSEFRFNLDATSADFRVRWPHNDISAAKNGIVVDGTPILEIKHTDNPLEPVLISGKFTDYLGNTICSVEDNEFKSHSGKIGDFQILKNRFIYKSLNGFLSLDFVLNSKEIVINQIYHVSGDAFIRSIDDCLLLGNYHTVLAARDNRMHHCDVAISIDSNTDSWDFIKYDPIKFAGRSIFNGNSMSHVGSGLYVGGSRRYKPAFQFGRWKYSY